jgi:predicted nucleic acid-binding protein
VVNVYFLDSSALVKRYVTETGSSWIQTIADQAAGHTLVVARITWVEVLAAFARLQRESNLPSTDIATAVRAFYYDWDAQYEVVELDAALAQEAGQLVQQHPLRAYDSVQLASALRLLPLFAQTNAASLLFVSADKRLLAVAQTAGLTVENPNDYL